MYSSSRVFPFSFKLISDDGSSVLFLYKRIRDFFAAVEGRYDDEQGAAGDDETEFAVPDCAFFVCGVLAWLRRRSQMKGLGRRCTCHGFLDIVQHQVHELVVAFQGPDDCGVLLVYSSSFSVQSQPHRPSSSASWPFPAVHLFHPNSTRIPKSIVK